MTEDDVAEVTLCAGVERERADEVVLALASAGIASRVTAGAAAWDVLVAAEDAAAAERVLVEMQGDEREALEPPAVPEAQHRSRLGIVSAAVLLLSFAVAGPRDVSRPSGWFEVGAATAARIRGGEPWRAVTAMFLHADPVHLAGNVVAALLFVGAVGRAFGSGLGAVLVLGSGAAANLMTAGLVIGPWSSVGASSGTFAALGIMAGHQLTLWRRRKRLGRRAWVPVAAALALFGMLGVGERADVFAHLFGISTGLGVGIAATVWCRRRGVPGRAAQVLLAMMASAAVALAWMLASRHGAAGILFPWGRGAHSW